MKQLTTALAIFAALTIALPSLALAADPLFINLTTDDPHRAKMGISFGSNQLKLGHPLTIFFNDRGVMVADQSNAERFAEHQQAMAKVLAQNGRIIVCPMCMKHYGIKKEDLVQGAQVGKPELTGSALFQENTKTLTW